MLNGNVSTEDGRRLGGRHVSPTSVCPQEGEQDRPDPVLLASPTTNDGCWSRRRSQRAAGGASVRLNPRTVNQNDSPISTAYALLEGHHGQRPLLDLAQ